MKNRLLEHQAHQWYHIDDPTPGYQGAPDSIIESFGDVRSIMQKRKLTLADLLKLRNELDTLRGAEASQATSYVLDTVMSKISKQTYEIIATRMISIAGDAINKVMQQGFQDYAEEFDPDTDVSELADNYNMTSASTEDMNEGTREAEEAMAEYLGTLFPDPDVDEDIFMGNQVFDDFVVQNIWQAVSWYPFGSTAKDNMFHTDSPNYLAKSHAAKDVEKMFGQIVKQSKKSFTESTSIELSESFGEIRSAAHRHALKPNVVRMIMLAKKIRKLPEAEQPAAFFYVAQMMKNADFTAITNSLVKNLPVKMREIFDRNVRARRTFETALEKAQAQLEQAFYEFLGKHLGLDADETLINIDGYIDSLVSEMIVFFGPMEEPLRKIDRLNRAQRITNEFDNAIERILGIIVANAATKASQMSEGVEQIQEAVVFDLPSGVLQEGVSAEDIVQLSTFARPHVAASLTDQMTRVQTVEEANRILNMVSHQVAGLGVASIDESNGYPAFLYVNRGDVYTTTVAYDVKRNAFYKTEAVVLQQLSESRAVVPVAALPAPSRVLPSIATHRLNESTPELQRAFGELRSFLTRLRKGQDLGVVLSDMPLIGNHRWAQLRSEVGQAYLRQAVIPYIHETLKSKGVYRGHARELLRSIAYEDAMFDYSSRLFDNEDLGVGLLTALKKLYDIPDGVISPRYDFDAPYITLDDILFPLEPDEDDDFPDRFADVDEEMVRKAAVEVVGDIGAGKKSAAADSVREYIGKKLSWSIGGAFMRLILLTNPGLSTSPQFADFAKKAAPAELKRVEDEVAKLLSPEFAISGSTAEMFDKNVNTSKLGVAIEKFADRLISKL